MISDPVVATLLAALLAEVQALRSDLRDQRAGPSAADAAFLAVLLPVLDRSRETTWSTADILEHADRIPALVALLAEYAIDDGGVRRLGRRLADCAGVRVNGLVLERVGARGGVALYQVVRNPQNPLRTARCSP